MERKNKDEKVVWMEGESQSRYDSGQDRIGQNRGGLDRIGQGAWVVTEIGVEGKKLVKQEGKEEEIRDVQNRIRSAVRNSSHILDA